MVVQNRHITFRAPVALEPLVSLMSQLGPCRSRISGDRQTDRQTNTDTQTKYSDPRCACAPRVNKHYLHLYQVQKHPNKITLIFFVLSMKSVTALVRSYFTGIQTDQQTNFYTLVLHLDGLP